jgi:nucleotide-binding universal stress UspA family protein
MFNRMLVPIDGSHSSATIVPYAAEMAKRIGCRVDLLLVEPPDGGRLPHPEHHRAASGDGGTAVATAATEVREANTRYVQRHVEEFEALGVEATGQVVSGDPVDQILEAALKHRSDVIAMASRKLSNYSKRDTGSVSEEVLWRSKLPVLIIAHG